MGEEPEKSLADANRGNTADNGKAAGSPVDGSEQVRETGEQEEETKQQPAEKPQQEQKKQGDYLPAHKRPRRHYFSIFKNSVTKLHPVNVKARLTHYKFEYSRVLHLTRKPTKQEYKELAIMVVIGTFIIGAIGFVVQMAIQYA